MAMTLLSTVSAALSLMYTPRLTTQINSVAVLPHLLPVIPGEGKSVNWTGEFTGAANAVASADGVARSSTDADAEIEVPATLPWAQYDKTSSVSDLSEAAVASNFNPESAGAMGLDLLLGKLITQGRRIALGVATDLYAGNPGATPPQLAGAARAIDSSGTFASIDPVTYTEWASVEQNLSAASLSFDALRSWMTAIYDACGYMPEFVTCDSTRFNAVRALYTDYDAYVVREVSVARGGGADGEEPRVVKLNAGMRAVMVDDVPFVLDRFATASTFYSWNTQFVTMRQLDPYRSLLDQGPEAIIDVFRRLTDNGKLVLPREQIEGMMARGPGLRPHIKLLGDRGLSKEAVLALWAQLEWKRRNAFGKLLLT